MMHTFAKRAPVGDNKSFLPKVLDSSSLLYIKPRVIWYLDVPIFCNFPFASLVSPPSSSSTFFFSVQQWNGMICFAQHVMSHCLWPMFLWKWLGGLERGVGFGVGLLCFVTRSDTRPWGGFPWESVLIFIFLGSILYFLYIELFVPKTRSCKD